MLRVGSMDNPLLSLSSLSIIARSTLHILYTYRSMYATTKNFNLAVPQFKRTVHCGQLVLLCYCKGELVLAEALEGLRMTCYLLEQFAFRWRTATEAMEKILTVAEAFGEHLLHCSDSGHANMHPFDSVSGIPLAELRETTRPLTSPSTTRSLPDPSSFAAINTSPAINDASSSIQFLPAQSHPVSRNPFNMNTLPAEMIPQPQQDGCGLEIDHDYGNNLAWNFDLGAFLSEF